MKDAVRVLTVSYILFILMLSLSGSVSGILSDIIYCLSFALPLILGIYSSKRLKIAREEEAGLLEENVNFFRAKPRELVALLPLLMPVVGIVFLVSYLTALTMGAFGIESAPVENIGIIKMLLIHALVPAVLEELVFRLLPLMLLLPYSPRYCVIISSLCFSLCHCDVFKMPYAFVAGVLFMIIDIMSESVLPSVIFHFINNAVSIVWIVIPDGYRLLFVLALIALALLSLVFVFIKRERFKDGIRQAMRVGEGFLGSREMLILAALTMTVSVTNLFVR